MHHPRLCLRWNGLSPYFQGRAVTCGLIFCVSCIGWRYHKRCVPGISLQPARCHVAPQRKAHSVDQSGIDEAMIDVGNATVKFGGGRCVRNRALPDKGAYKNKKIGRQCQTMSGRILQCHHAMSGRLAALSHDAPCCAPAVH